MTMPAGIGTVTLSGRYIRPDGAPLSGTVTFTSPSLLTLSGADTVATGSATVTLDSAGSFTVVLVATDNANMQPTGWAYNVTEKFTGVTGRTYALQLPSTTPTVNIADIAPADPTAGNYVTVAGPQGLPGTDGQDGTGGVDGRTILSGLAAPASGAGANGDFYIDTNAWTIYGPKAAGAWPAGHALSPEAGGAVASVNDLTGAVVLTAASVGADPAGAAATAQQTAQTYTDSAMSAEVSRANGAYVGTADARLSNSRTPTSHAASHATGGTDAVTPAAIGAATSADVTTALAGHVADVAHGDQPSENGLLAWTYDPNMAGHVTAQSNAGVAGRVTLSRLIIRKTVTWSNVWLGLAGIDASAVLSNCYLGVYDASGALKATTADISSSLMTSAIAKPFALAAPFTATPGVYFVAMLLNGTWATNSLTFKASGAGISVNAGLSAPNLRYSNMLTAQTSLPSSLTLSGQTTTIINTGWASQWYGVS